MKKKSASRSAFFNPRVLISLAFCAIGVFLALFAFAVYPGATAQASQNQPDVQALAQDSITMPDGQVTEEPSSELVGSNTPLTENGAIDRASGGQIDGGACSQIIGGLNPQGLTESGVAAPAGFFWSEVQHDAGNMTESNTSAGFSVNQGTFRLADNFTLSQPCTLNNVVFYAYQTGAPASPSPFTAYTLQIHNGRPGDPGVMVVFGDTTTNRLASSVDSTYYRIFNTVVPPPGTASGTTRKIWKNTVTIGTTLPAGTYWLDWASTVSNGGAHFQPSKTIAGARGAAGDNGRQLTVAGGTWADAIDTGNPATAADVLQDFPFELNGTAGGGGTPSPTPTATATATSGGPTPTATATSTAGGSPSCPAIITQSTSQTIVTSNSVSCNNGTGHTDNSYWRAFNMGTFVGGAAYNVTSVSFGVESANNTQPVTVRLYTNAGAPFPGGTRTQIATSTISVTAAQTGTVVTTPMVVTVPAATTELVMELFTPDGTTAGNLFFVGSNAATETGPSYLSATACGITVPTTTAAIGFPNMHIVFNVNGSCGAGGPSPTASATVSGTPSPSPSCAPGWAAGPAVPVAGAVRAPGNYFPANGRFYVVGGRSADTAGADFTNPFEYNPATNTWATKVATFPDNKVCNMACGVLTVGGTPQIYCVGGNASQVVGTTGRVLSYNPATDTTTALTAADDWPGSQAGTFLPGGFAVSGNKLYIIGSFNANSTPPVVTGQVWQFDPTAAVGSRWLARADYPVTRAYVPAASIGTIIYTGGGSNLDAGGLLIDTTDSFMYDTATNTWTAIASIPRATGETRAVVVNNQMWVLGGGRVAPNPSNEVDIYNPGSNTWTTGLPFVTARRNFPADSDGSSVFLAGGYDTSGTTLLNTMEIFGAGSCVTPTPGTPTPTATATATATATVAASPSPSVPPPSATPSATASATASTAPSATPSVTPAAQALNLATRMRVLTGANIGIEGLIIQGTAPKQVLLRGIGPSLANFGVPDPLADPVMELHGPAGFTTITNDNWGDTQRAAIKATGLAPTNELESAILATLDPGSYTAQVRGNIDGTGVGIGIVEAYDLDPPEGPSQLGNIATRAFVGAGGDIMIAGFILGGNPDTENVIVRGIGPSLTQFGVPDALADPTLELRDNNGALLRANNDWQDDPAQAALITAAGLAPTDPLESALEATLPPGQYTALLAGLNSGTGVGLVEAYNLGAGGTVVPTPTPTPGLTSPTPAPTATATATATAGGSPPPATPTPPPATPTPPAATPTPSAGPPCVENFDSVTAPAFPAGWVASNPDPGDGTMWVTSTTSPESAPNDAFVPDQDGISDKVLDRMSVNVTSATATMSWRNNFNTEFSDGIYWDGYVLEVSSPNISGGDFLDITDSHVGGSFVSGGYTGEIDGTANNPLAGRLAWSADSGGYIDTVINLGPNLTGPVTFRFRMGTDEAVAATGVRIDNIVFTGASCP